MEDFMDERPPYRTSVSYGTSNPVLTQPQEHLKTQAEKPPQPMLPAAPISQRTLTNYKWLMGVFFGIHLLYLLYLQTRRDVAANSGLRVISDLLVEFGALACTVVYFYAVSKIRRMPDAANIMVKRAWQAAALLGCASGAYAIGQAIWTWYEAVYPTSAFPFPASYDPFYLLVYPFSAIGIILLVPRGGTIAGRTRLLLDAATAALSILAISWYFILGPTIATLSGSPLAKVVGLAYPLGDLLLCLVATILLFGPSGSTALNSTLGRLSIGVTLLAITDSLYAYFQIQGTYHTGFLQDIGWPMSWLFIGWAVLMYVNDLVHLTGERRVAVSRYTNVGRVGVALRAITPVVLALVTCALLLLGDAVRNTAPLIQVVLVCAGLFLLPIIRQALTLIDSQSLNERLHSTQAQLEQALAQSQNELLSTTSRAEQFDELSEGIEDLKAVLAQLAHGDLRARARVQGRLAEVAQSLNLLIDRIRGWGQIQQVNRLLENEASQLTRQIEMLADGQLPSALLAPPSPYPTGAALIALSGLQGRLQLRFHSFQEVLYLLQKRTQVLIQGVAQMRQQGAASLSMQQLSAIEQVEKSLTNYQQLIEELLQQTNVYGGSQPLPATPFKSNRLARYER
jgi:hypothetical protein